MRISLPHCGEMRPVLHELNVISCNQSHYNPTARRGQLTLEQVFWTGNILKKPVMWTDCSMELKNCGNWGKVKEPFDALIAVLTTSRVRVGWLASLMQWRSGKINSHHFYQKENRYCHGEGPGRLPSWQTSDDSPGDQCRCWKKMPCSGTWQTMGAGRESIWTGD